MSRRHPDRPKGSMAESVFRKGQPPGPPRPKDPPTEGRPPITSKTMAAAITGSYGDTAMISRALRTTTAEITRLLSTRVGGRWDRCRVLMERENEKTANMAERTVRHCIRQRGEKTLGVALNAAKFHLEKRRRGVYGDHRTVTIEGGERPLRVESERKVSAAALAKLPVEARRILLAELDAEDAKKKGGRDGE